MFKFHINQKFILSNFYSYHQWWNKIGFPWNEAWWSGGWWTPYDNLEFQSGAI